MEDRLRHVEFKRPGRETVASSLARPGCMLALPAPATTEHGVTVAGHPARSMGNCLVSWSTSQARISSSMRASQIA